MKLNKEQEKFITENYASKGLKWCAETTGLTENQIRYYCYKTGLKLNTLGKKVVAERISTANRKLNKYSHYYNCDKYSAYILGWIWSDGYVGKYRISIGIVQEDAKDVSLLLNHFNDFKTIDEISEGRKPKTTFYLNSVELCSYLQNCGKYPHSSDNYNKLLSNINKELWVYFFRGIIDGDGSFYFNTKTNTYQISITSNYNQDWSSIEEFLNNNSITFTIQKESSKWGSHSKLRITGNNNVKKLVNILYIAQDNIWLNRKYNKIKSLIDEKA